MERCDAREGIIKMTIPYRRKKVYATCQVDVTSHIYIDR